MTVNDPEVRVSSAERAYRALRAMAISFVLRPGERINEVEMARRLEMSRAPVREALNRLATEGLLTVQANHGFFCRRLSAHEISQLSQVRADLEAGGALVAAGRADQTALLTLAAAWRAAAAQADQLSVAELVAHDEAFHLALAASSGNHERARLLDQINARLHYVRLINLEHPLRRHATFAEHETIITALLQGDGPAAAAALRQHITLSHDEALEVIQIGLGRLYAE
ncbi:MAG: GntR family transcriptional regulator [Oscillochloridaceae bacterium umkhey_bin13]